MGYTTRFQGKVTITPQLKPADHKRLEKYIDDGDNYDYSIRDAGTAIAWSGMEKSYEMDYKMQDIINACLTPYGYKANGILVAQGEASDDRWRMVVKDNKVSRLSGHGADDLDPSERITREELVRFLLTQDGCCLDDQDDCVTLAKSLLGKYKISLK